MKCSDCSHRLKPIVCVDIDGTISEYHRHLGQHICRYWGLHEPQTPLGDWLFWDGTGNYEDHFGITQDQYREAKLSFRQGGYKRWSPVMEGAHLLRSYLKQLQDAGRVEVWITTTRPWNRLDSTDPDTRFWLDRHFPVYDHLLYDERKYPRLTEIVNYRRVIAVVDDLPEQLEEAAMMFGPHVPFQAVRPHNSKARERLTVNHGDLYGFRDHVQRNLDDWEAINV